MRSRITSAGFPVRCWTGSILHIEVPAVKFREITSERTGETSAPIRERVVTARHVQQERFKEKPRITCNARMGTRELKQHCDERGPGRIGADHI